MDLITGLLALFIILLLIVIAGGVFWLRRTGDKPNSDASLALLQQHILDLNKSIDARLTDAYKVLQEQFQHSQKNFSENFAITSKISQHSTQKIEEITEKLTRLEETNKKVVSISEQLRDLEDILKNPKQRGILGEYYLETLLKNVLPTGSYQMQYSFADGMIVDAAVFVKDKIIPIDSKFSLENYNRLVESKDEVERAQLEKTFVSDLKNRTVETSKYIRPQEGTMEFAFMFIPHEAIYYDLIINKIGAGGGSEGENLIQRASSKYHVTIVSPTSFLAYLQTVLQGLRALQIEETAKDIIKQVTDLHRHLWEYEKFFSKLGNTLGTAVNHYNDAGKEWRKIDKDVTRITDGAAGGEAQVPLLSRPESDEE